MKSKLLLLFAGGTIGMIHNPQTNALEPAQSAVVLLEQIPELADVADIDFQMVINLDSSNMNPTHWSMIAERIHEHYDLYDGFVVIQGTDTMAYSASALSFALQNTTKPVVFTGSLIPLREMGSDARNNLVYACMTASLDIAEVCIVLSNTILRANRAKKHHESFVAAFHSPNFPALGELGRPIVLRDWCKRRHEGNMQFHKDFDASIALIKLFPGFDPRVFEHMIGSDVHAVIIEGFGPGNVPFLDHSVIPYIKKMVDSNVAVIISNQMEHGKTSLKSYEAGLRAYEVGAVGSGDMTNESVITKLMWALPQYKQVDEICRIMQTDVAGEITS